MSAGAIITSEIYSQEQVKKINGIVQKHLKLHVGDTIPNHAEGKIKRGQFTFINTLDIVDDLYVWFDHCQRVNNQYFGYDIHWQFNIDTCIYNEYNIGDEYDWHMDSMDQLPNIDTKITCLLNLSEEPYEGGDFYTVGSNEPREFTSGMGLIMTSLAAHKVTPVTKGKRTTMTYWGSGPPWR